MTNYWIFKVTDEASGLYGRNGVDIFEHRIKEKFWSIREYNEKGKKESKIFFLEKGDFVVFYLVGKFGSSFIGTCVLDSSYETLSEVDAKKIVHREYVDYNKVVFIRDIQKWKRHLPVQSLKDKELFHGRTSIGSYFQGSIKQIKNGEDFKALVALYKNFL